MSSNEISIRITRTGKIKYWVAHALECLENDKAAIVLHTLPGTRKETAEAGPEESKSTSKASASLITTPRLISVVEIIKREYLKDLDKKRSTRLFGLHQYNEIGTLEDLGLVDGAGNSSETADEQRMKDITMALEGKNFPKQHQSPYMKVTLSNHELPELLKQGATYQKPLIRTMSKGAKRRAKAKRKKVTEEPEAPTVAEVET